MSNERIDEFLSWRGRLDDRQGVPGQGLDDREATWERLMDKISETPRRRRFFVYRLAAACALLALIPTVRFFQDRHTRIVPIRPALLKRVASPAPSPMPVAPSPMPAPAVTVPVATKRMGRDGLERSGKRPPRGPQEQPPQLAGLPAARATVTVPPPDPAIAQLNIKPLKNKPLRVVHINELPGAPGPLPAMAASDAGRHFTIFLSPAQSRMALPPPPPVADAALFKIKLSSN
jgi:hypothetical protein